MIKEILKKRLSVEDDWHEFVIEGIDQATQEITDLLLEKVEKLRHTPDKLDAEGRPSLSNKARHYNNALEDVIKLMEETK